MTPRQYYRHQRQRRQITQLAAVIKDSASDFTFFSGSASFLLPTLYLEGVGETMAYANIAPEHCTASFRAFQAGEHTKTRRLQMEILDLNTAFTSDFGVIGLKYTLECLGYYGGPCRDPLPEQLSEEGKEFIQKLMKNLFACINIYFEIAWIGLFQAQQRTGEGSCTAVFALEKELFPGFDLHNISGFPWIPD